MKSTLPDPAHHWSEERLQQLNETLELRVAERTAEAQAAALRLQGIVDSAMDAIISVDEHQQIVLFNAAAEKMFDYTGSEMLGQPLAQLIPHSFRHAHEHHIHKFGVTGVTTRTMGALRAVSGLRRNGEEFPVEASISQMEADGQKIFTVILRDITEKKKLEAQFLRTQRLESIGTLASGIAHDLNNILAPILMAVQILQTKFPDKQGRQLLEVLQISALRGAEMVKQVLSFARGGGNERIPLQITHLVKEIMKVLQETLPRSIQIRCSLPPDLPPVNGDPTQLHQVLMNLCVNARDAMPTGGTLTIQVAQMEIDPAFAAQQSGAQPGSYLLITVTDTGTGMESGIIDKIFDPFFTTKEPGKGTGLGLATVLGIVQSHGGFINFDSEPGQGTQFRIYLPIIKTESPEAAHPGNIILPAGQGETILIVDDEAAIREITKSTLEAYNYCVLTASDGLAALALFAQHKDEINVVVTDMMMPFMNGAETIQALKKIKPGICIIAVSGITIADKLDADTAAQVNAFLAKPFTAKKLLETIAGVLYP